ncbi:MULTISPECIES: hypothetical protein [unclassified Microbacterium]|uniref:hypothetical protein n=1 Tax=unclassified Microbacterium TaxID=2609290 RepID=UPI0012FC3135|nr:hypothetical protein [Microbacterium sp. MAH-37]MVQ41956.1 hypothetical protein [Microbacterium sp. MAH-37]
MSTSSPGDRSRGYWRAEHERAWRGTLEHATDEFDLRMPVVRERFEGLYADDARTPVRTSE